jgi:hypothetical protein
MNGLIKFSICLGLLATVAACSGGSGGGGAPATPPPPIQQHINPNGIQGSINGPININGTVPPIVLDNGQVPNFALDPQGRALVINRRLQLVHAGVNQRVLSDNCSGSNSISIHRNRCLNGSNYCQVTTTQHNLILDFDGQGVLIIYSFNEFGNAQSAPGVQYTLSPSDRTISISGFQLNGVPNQSYIALKANRSGYDQFGGSRNYPDFSVSSTYSNYDSLYNNSPGNYNRGSSSNFYMPSLQNTNVGNGGSGDLFGSNSQPYPQQAQGSISINSPGFTLEFLSIQSDPSRRVAHHLRTARITRDNAAQLDASIIVNGQANSCDTELSANLLGIFN